MGKLARRLVEVLRAGALAAGTSFLLGVWCQGMARLGFRGVYPDGLPDFLAVFGLGVAAGAALGWATPAARPLHLMGRVAGTALAAILVGGALGGFTAVLVKFTRMAERDLPYYFVPVGLALVAVGLQRLPRSTVARVALGVPVALLVVSRLLVLWPDGAHAITRKVFPLPPATVRSELERVGWGQLAIDNRTKIVDFQTTPSYHTENSYLVSESTMKFTLEAIRPFFEDACGQLSTSRPTIPAFVHNYPTQQACEKEHPARKEVRFEMYHYQHSPCCVFEVKERHPGEQFNTTRKWDFIFQHLAWRAVK
jgi:hypothetical protein